MWDRFRRYRALDPESRAIFWRAARLLPQVALSLRLRGYAQTEAALHSRASKSSLAFHAGSDSERTVQRTARMVRAAARNTPIRTTCLVQSLTLWFLLQQQNISTSIKIGVRKNGSRLEAHAWVERDGAAINETGEVHQHYAPFEREFANPSSESS